MSDTTTTEPVVTYEIAEGRSELWGAWWTVVLYEDGVAKGGDKHWLTRNVAELALDAYEIGMVEHGATERQTLAAIASIRATRAERSRSC